MTVSDELLYFRSKICRDGHDHRKCAGRWEGLGFDVKCECDCHVKKAKEDDLDK